jgi:hypothetical protein
MAWDHPSIGKRKHGKGPATKKAKARERKRREALAEAQAQQHRRRRSTSEVGSHKRAFPNGEDRPRRGQRTKDRY